MVLAETDLEKTPASIDLLYVALFFVKLVLLCRTQQRRSISLCLS